MTRPNPNAERVVTRAIVLVLNGALAVALAWLAVVYWRVVRPGIEAVPALLRDGLPVAICMGVLHFGRRAWRTWRDLRER